MVMCMIGMKEGVQEFTQRSDRKRESRDEKSPWMMHAQASSERSRDRKASLSELYMQ